MGKTVASWLNRSVRIVDGIDPSDEVGVVLAVDDTPYRPSAWVKLGSDQKHPSYRSCDLCWLQDVETDEIGPAWGTDGPDA